MTAANYYAELHILQLSTCGGWKYATYHYSINAENGKVRVFYRDYRNAPSATDLTDECFTKGNTYDNAIELNEVMIPYALRFIHKDKAARVARGEKLTDKQCADLGVERKKQ